MKTEEFKNLYLDTAKSGYYKNLREIISSYLKASYEEFEKQIVGFIDNLFSESQNLTLSTISYSSITGIVYQIDDDNSKDLSQLCNILKVGLKSHYDNKMKNEKIEDIDKESELAKRYTIIKKTIEHLDLAIIQKESLYLTQKAEIQNSKDDIHQISNGIASVKEEIKDIKDEAQNLIESTKDSLNDLKVTKGQIYTEFVAILGIFASIIFGVFGGFQEIQVIGKNLNTTPIPKLLIFSSLVMLGITLIIFLCFNAISKLTNKPLRSCNCEAGKCNCNFRKRHPTIFYSSCIYLYVLLVGFALRLYKYDDFKFNDLYNGIREGYDILPLLLLILPIFIPFVVYIRRKIKKYHYKKKKEKRAKNISNNIKKFIKYKWNVHKNNKS